MLGSACLEWERNYNNLMCNICLRSIDYMYVCADEKSVGMWPTVDVTCETL